MMVRAVENLIAGVGGEGREEINSALLQQVCLIPAGRAIRQLSFQTSAADGIRPKVTGTAVLSASRFT